MATCTPLYGLPYAEGSDPPCDIDETLCEFAAAVEAQLDALDAVVDRTTDTLPMAQVKLTTPFTITSIGNTTATVPFDTISFDTANFVELAENAYQATLPRAGRYQVSFQLLMGVAPVNDLLRAAVMPSSIIYDEAVSDGTAPVYFNGAYELRYAPPGSGVPVDTTNPVLTLAVSVLVGTYTVTSATLCIAWIGDLP